MVPEALVPFVINISSSAAMASYMQDTWTPVKNSIIFTLLFWSRLSNQGPVLMSTRCYILWSHSKTVGLVLNCPSSSDSTKFQDDREINITLSPGRPCDKIYYRVLLRVSRPLSKMKTSFYEYSIPVVKKDGLMSTFVMRVPITGGTAAGKKIF